MTDPTILLEEIDRLLEADAVLQRKKLLKLGRSLLPHLTEDDLAQPHDYEELRTSEQFNFEDGYLAGILGAQMAIRARIGSKYR